MPLFQNLEFALGVHDLRSLPPPDQAEVAFAGRSNAGKSSAINALARRTRLAFVSKTPGRTQQINFFRISGGGYLVDLPGYGYAKVPEATRAHWQKVLPRYLAERASLCGLVLIMDARHPLTESDQQMLDWFGPSQRPIHVLITKVDKISRSEAAMALRAVRAKLAAMSPRFSAQLFSAVDRIGLEEAESIIGGWLEPRAQKEKSPG